MNPVLEFFFFKQRKLFLTASQNIMGIKLYEKRQPQLKNLMNLVEFSSYISYFMIASCNGWKIYNVIPCKYYVTCHCVNTMLLWKYKLFYKQRIFLAKLHCCLTFLWIEPHVALVLLITYRYDLTETYFAYLCPCLRLKSFS